MNCTKPIPPDIQLHRTRLRDKSGYTATIVYYGSVASATNPEEMYFGVVWDDKERGKHDGSVVDRQTQQLVRHFSAPHPTAGSFVKVSKSDLGVALTPHLLYERYVRSASNELVAPQNLLPHTAQTVSGRNDKPIELLGELLVRSQQQLSELQSVSLRQAGVARIDPATEWSCLEHLSQLDLAGNLLWEWKELLSTLIGVLPNLTHLNLAGNRLGDHSLKENTYSMYPSLTHLNLRQTCVSKLSSLLTLGQVFPNLQELVLVGCPLESLIAEGPTDNSNTADSLADVFPHLALLDCSECSLTSAQPFSRLPKLSSLSLNANPLTSWPMNPPEGTGSFSSLQHLQLADTQLQAWNDLRPLFSYASLTLRLVRCYPLFDDLRGVPARRLATLAHLPRLFALNGSRVTSTERRDAARWYVRHQQQHASEGSGNFDDPIASCWHELFPDLSSVPTASIISDPNNAVALADALLHVTIRSMVAASCHKPSVSFRLPLQTTVSRLKALCARKFDVEVEIQVLQYVLSDGLPVTIEDDDAACLADVGVPDGAEILVKERAESEWLLQQEKQQAQQDFETRLKKQEEQYLQMKKAASAIQS